MASMKLALTLTGDGKGFPTITGDGVGYAKVSDRKSGSMVIVTLAIPLASLTPTMQAAMPHYVDDGWQTATHRWSVVKPAKGTWTPSRPAEDVPPITGVRALGKAASKAAIPAEGLADMLQSLTPADRKALRDMLK